VSVPLQTFDARAAGWHAIEEPPPDPEAAAPRQHEIELSSELGPLGATITLPLAGEGPFPGVLLLAGSGPQDRDETVGPNKPLRDLAVDLASAGVASLRFDKRAHLIHREAEEARIERNTDRLAEIGKLAREVTLREEYLADATAALAELAKHPQVRDDALFVAGHSLGALVAPEIARAHPGVRGVILLAAMGRPFEDVLEEQLAFQQRAAGIPAEQAAAAARESVEPIRRARRGELAPGELPLGVGAAYWRDVLSRDPPAVVAASPHPILLLHAGKDVQIRDADYAALRAALAARAGIDWHAERFPELNHLFMPVTGEPTGSEYGIAGHVDPAVARTIAEWIARHSEPPPR
jgi:dienelactone hydrolase